MLGGPLLPGLGPVGLAPRLGQALARVGEFGFQAADGLLQVAFGRRGGFEVMIGISQGPFGRLDLLLAAVLALRPGSAGAGVLGFLAGAGGASGSGARPKPA